MVDEFASRNNSFPDTALETARLYRQRLDIKPQENDSPGNIIDRVAKARAEIIKMAQDSEIQSDISLGVLLLKLISINKRDMVNLVYGTQGEKPLTFKAASDSITRLVGARMEDLELEIDPNLKALAARSENNKVKKRQNNKKRPRVH